MQNLMCRRKRLYSFCSEYGMALQMDLPPLLMKVHKNRAFHLAGTVSPGSGGNETG